MACDKFKIPCNRCDYAANQDICPGVNFWNDFCGLPKIPEDKILKKPVKKVFGKLFNSLQKFLPEFNFQTLSSNKVSTLKRDEVVTLLKGIRLKNKELIPQDYIIMKNEDMKSLLYKTMIEIYEKRN